MRARLDAPDNGTRLVSPPFVFLGECMVPGVRFGRPLLRTSQRPHVPLTPTASPMTEPLESAAAKLLVGAGDDAAPSKLAAHVVRTLEHLTHHLMQVVGEAGVRAVFARSAALSSAAYPWLARTIPIVAPTGSPWDALRVSMERQDTSAIRGGFIALLSTFIELLGRLIGAGLVQRLLHDVWPDVVPQAVKETP